MWRIVLPLLVLACLVGCAPAPATEDPFAEPGTTQGEDTNPATSVIDLTTVEARVLPSGLVEIGSASAPHTLLLFLTPGSSYSQAYGTEYLPQIIDQWVKRGELRVHVGFVPFNRYPQTTQASVTFLCATTQGQGVTLLGQILQNPGTTLPPTECAYSQESVAGLQSMISSLHVTLVPTAFFDGEKDTGLPDWADLRGRLDRLTAE